MENLVFLATEHASHQGFNLGNMAINILAVLILLVLLKKFAWDKLIDMLDERQRLVEGQLDDAARNQKEALVLLEENQEKLKNAQQEIKVMMEDAREQSKIEKQAILQALFSSHPQYLFEHLLLIVLLVCELLQE